MDRSAPHFKYHVFFCTNQRETGAACCAAHCAADLRGYAKDRVKALHLNGPSKVRINSAGCLDRCDDGPVCVVYPQGVWYRYLDQDDIDEIVTEHLQHDRIVERLKI